MIQIAVQLYCHRQYDIRHQNYPSIGTNTPVPSNHATVQILSCFSERVIETIFGKANRESTPALVINPISIIELVLIMKVVPALVASGV
jgi:hypothetical protein